MNFRQTVTRMVRWTITSVRLLYRAIPINPSTRSYINSFIYRRLTWIRVQMLLRELKPTWTSGSEETPKVSIIVPVFGKLEITLSCIRSIAVNPQKNTFELIIVDDSSPDATSKWINKIPGLKVVTNDVNVGFIQSCNNGASAASGEFLHFLNNDTLVTSNWLDELVWTFESFSSVGLVGSKLLYPDGRLQEAGAIVWRDGTAWNYGRGQDPNRPEFNYARQVDYCSGASILVKKTTFKSLGGFDTYFSPAYYEDTDFAQKITKSGLRVMYQPGSVVYHIEGSTSGKDLAKGIKQHQVTNGEKFANRWAEELSGHGEPETEPNNEKDRFVKKRVLFLDHNLPTPDKDAGSGVAINTMILLREFGFQVTFAAPKNWVYDEIYTQLLQKNGIETLHEPYQRSLDSHLADCGSRYDLVIGCRANILVESLPLLKIYCPKAPVVFHTADLHFLRLEREAKVSKNWNTMKIAEEYKKLEPWLIDQTDVTIIHGDYEKPLLESMGADPNKLVVFPLMINVPDNRTSFESRNGIIFVGGFNHTPNVDAVEFMCHEVMPILSNLNPEIVLTVVGSNVTKEIEALETTNVKIVGHVHDLDGYLQTFKISVAPLRYGAGLKGKVAKAMANGTPVVASRVAIEGINLMPEKDFLLANSPEEIAKQISRLYNDEALWEMISQNSYHNSQKLWGFEPAVQSLKEVLSKVGLDQESPATETKFI